MSSARDKSQPERPAFTRGTNLLLVPTCAVILIAGLQAASSLLVPIMVAGFLTLVCLPGMQRLRRIGVPTGVAIGLVITVGLLMAVGVGSVVAASVTQFTARIPEYDAALERQVWYKQLEDTLSYFGALDGGQFKTLRELLDTQYLLAQLTTILGAVVGQLSNLLVIALILIFMLAEASCIGPKITAAFGQPASVLEQMQRVNDRVTGYVSIKVGVSLLTGLLVTGLTYAIGVDFPVLWGFVAFVFNFIPNIGSIIAAIPAVLICLIRPGLLEAGILAGGYMLINVVVGNLLEPRLMGRKLGLSTLVVFLSLIFWAWVWGPVGMLLSVPLTVVVKIVLEDIEEFRPIAVLLGPSGEERAEMHT